MGGTNNFRGTMLNSYGINHNNWLNRIIIMFTKINQSQFIDSFRNMGRETQFSYGALVALFHHMEDTEENCGEEVELDVVALCCEFTEYSDLKEFNEAYNNGDTNNNYSIEDIESCTTVILISKGESFLVQNF
jgi:hypothetical protein